jgi:FixJ family two-component response regulator
VTAAAQMAREEAVVLVVDDEPTVAGQLAEGLEASGFRVRVAHMAAEALDHVRRSPEIVVVVSDIRMPGGDGLQLARDIQAGRTNDQAVEVIVITGHATIDDAAAAVRSRVSDFLRKPFRLSTAVEAVQQAMNRALERRSHDAERQGIARRLLEGEARRDELDRRLAVLTERLAATGAEGEASAAMQDRLHAVSHALRTPLNAISTSAELLHGLAAAGDAADYQRILQEGIGEASRAIQLVEELILAEGRPQAPAAPVSLEGLVRTCLVQVGRARPGRRIPAPDIAQDITVQAPRETLTRAVDLALEAIMDWTPTSGSAAAAEAARQDAAALRCDLARVDEGGHGWACITLVSGEGAGPLPGGHLLGAQSTRMSRTLETLGFLVARRLVERQGGCLTSMITASGHAVVRLALPLPA